MEELIVKLFYNLETEKKLGMKNQFNVHFSDKTYFFLNLVLLILMRNLYYFTPVVEEI